MNTDNRLLAAFEGGEIDNADFPHERHVSVAWMLAQQHPREEAFARLVAGIRRIAERAGRPGAYHETITRAWFELIAAVDDLARHPELLDKTLLSCYYSTARLAAGRDRWLEPDLHPLRLPPPPPKPMATDMRGLFSRIPAAIAVLGLHSADTVHASTVSSFTSVSREPKLVSVCLANGSRSLEVLHAAQAFALSVLASDQDALASHFADGGRSSGAVQFSGIPHHMSAYGPIIDTAAARMGCSLHRMHRCGDHHIVIGEVRVAGLSDLRPLLRHDGVYH